MTIAATREAADARFAEARRLLKEAHDLCLAAVDLCDHPREMLVHGEYVPSSYFNATPSFLVCRQCGYAEEGWHCGMWKLPSDAEYAPETPRVPRDVAWKLVRVWVSQDDMGKLGRYGEKHEEFVPNFDRRTLVRNMG